MTDLAADRPSILDVANHCGLSKATVSKALNAPADSKLVSARTRARVQDAVKKLGYRPNWRAQALARRRSQAIAIMHSSRVGAVPRGVYWEIVDSLEKELVERDYVPTFLHVRRAEERVEQMLSDGRFDGCISLGLIAPTVLNMLRRHKVPSVLINSGADATWSRVNPNDDQGGAEAVAHLLRQGHRRILYYAGEIVLDHPSAVLRQGAYRRCMREAGLEPLPPFVGTADMLVDHVQRSGEASPTAIVDFEHWSAIRVLQCLWRRGVRVPSDVSLITFNDTHPVADVIPPLTTVALPGQVMAVRAVEMLLRQLEEPERGPETVMLDETLVVRESTAPVSAR
jgi:DNA-binding LacI/PurR family transcriptional regulator